MESLRASILAIGRELVICTSNCDGIHRDPKVGSLPRCLILETDGREAKTGCAVVGINPGRADQDERDFYRKRGNTYEAVLERWTSNLGYRHPYYENTRSFLDRIGLTGPILWTEIAKCENQVGYKDVPPVSTLRTCAAHYLVRELAVIPPEWPLIALGQAAYQPLTYLAPERAVVGVPHPTGSHGQFSHVLANAEAMRLLIEEAIEARTAVWLVTPNKAVSLVDKKRYQLANATEGQLNRLKGQAALVARVVKQLGPTEAKTVAEELAKMPEFTSVQTPERIAKYYLKLLTERGLFKAE